MSKRRVKTSSGKRREVGRSYKETSTSKRTGVARSAYGREGQIRNGREL